MGGQRVASAGLPGFTGGQAVVDWADDDPIADNFHPPFGDALEIERYRRALGVQTVIPDIDLLAHLYFTSSINLPPRGNTKALIVHPDVKLPPTINSTGSGHR